MVRFRASLARPEMLVLLYRLISQALSPPEAIATCAQNLYPVVIGRERPLLRSTSGRKRPLATPFREIYRSLP